MGISQWFTFRALILGVLLWNIQSISAAAACFWGLSAFLYWPSLLVVVLLAAAVLYLAIMPVVARAFSYLAFECTQARACLLVVATFFVLWHDITHRDYVVVLLEFASVLVWPLGFLVCVGAFWHCQQEDERRWKEEERRRQVSRQRDTEFSKPEQPSCQPKLWTITAAKEVEESFEVEAYNLCGEKVCVQVKKDMMLGELDEAINEQIRFKMTQERGMKIRDKVRFIEGWQASDEYSKFGWIVQPLDRQEGSKTVTVCHLAPRDLPQWYSAHGKSTMGLGLAPCETLCNTTVPCKCVVLHDAEPGNIKLLLPSGKVLGEMRTDHTMSLIQLLYEVSE